MKVLLTGSTGFIGGRLLERLLAGGHFVVCPGRRPPALQTARTQWFHVDFSEPPAPGDWLPHLQGIDVVVNAVGIFRETAALTFEAAHVRTPCSLFAACLAAGVRRVVQLSALGADESAGTAYHASKKAADDYLLGLPLDAVVAQPSLVFGVAGTSSRLFLTLASLPVLMLPAGGAQSVQPVHVDDAVQALLALVEAPDPGFAGHRVALVGPTRLTLAGYLRGLREALGLPVAPALPVPAMLVACGARWGDLTGSGLLDTASWRMLQRGNAAAADAITRLLGAPPRGVDRFVSPELAAPLRTQAQLGWLLPLLRGAIAAVWIFTGIVSLGLYPVQESYALLARTGVAAPWRPTLLFGAAGLDLVLGVLTLVRLPGRRWLWIVQAGLILVYTTIITVKIPEFWLHPYGPLLKNLPMLAALLLLHVLEPRDGRWNT